jgi:hypothetical protein
MKSEARHQAMKCLTGRMAVEHLAAEEGRTDLPAARVYVREWRREIEWHQQEPLS